MNNNICHTTYKYKICVSGAAETGHCGAEAMETAKELGREIVGHNAILINGATTGFPLWAARGAKEAGGFVIGISPASSEKEHIEKYNLPVEYADMIVYTGFGYSGRNLLLTRSSDAVIISCGRMGTLNEFTIAFEDDKPIGVLTRTGGMADEIEALLEKAHRGKGKVIFDDDPERLMKRIISMVMQEKSIKI